MATVRVASEGIDVMLNRGQGCRDTVSNPAQKCMQPN